MKRGILDLFAGSGGLSLGFQMAGFPVIQAIELDQHSANTYKKNNSDVDLLCEDIRNISPEACAKGRYDLNEVGILLGGPPCKGFSESNRRTRNLSNKKNFLFLEFFRFLEVIKPPWFVLENVPGIRTLAGGILLKHIVELSRSFGYEVSWKEMNSVNFGIPQIRRRIFVIGNRIGKPILFPEPTHVTDESFTTVEDAISDLPVLSNGNAIDHCCYKVDMELATPYQQAMRVGKIAGENVQGNLVTNSAPMIIQRYRHIRPGENWGVIPEYLMINYKDRSRCHTGIYYRLQWHAPSRVIGNFRKNMLIHPDQNRGLSVREAARLQSFPDTYEFLGSIGFQQQQVADAVPPLLAQKIAETILKCESEETLDQYSSGGRCQQLTFDQSL